MRSLGASRVVLVVKNPPASAGDLTDVGSVPGGREKIPWRRAWQPTPVFLPRESHRGAWRATAHGVTELDMTKGAEHVHMQRGG